jgi:hypothetical protein
MLQSAEIGNRNTTTTTIQTVAVVVVAAWWSWSQKKCVCQLCALNL